MNAGASEEIRWTAYFLSVVLRTIALLVLCATGVTAYLVSTAGSTLLGVSADHDPGTWIVAVTGVSLSALFAGVGSGLALLCAIYDRQGNTAAPESLRRVAIDRASVTSPVPVQHTTQASSDSDRVETERNDVVSKPRSTPKSTYRPGSLMDHLTRERHFFRERSD